MTLKNTSFKNSVNSSLTRLSDRAHRTGKSFFRKQVFLAQAGDTKKVIINFHTQFEPIFQRYVEAHALLPAGTFGTLLSVDENSLIIETEYMGEQIANTPQSLRAAIEVLARLNDTNACLGTYRIPRYFELFFEKFDVSDFKEFFALNESLKQLPIKARTGYGIEDPAVSNFVTSNGQTYLIDLDNFANDYNLDSLIGFLMADAQLETLHQLEPELFVALVNEVTERAVDPTLLLCGALGRICITVIDDTAPQGTDMHALIERFARYIIEVRATSS